MYVSEKKKIFFNSFFGLFFKGYFNILLCCFILIVAPEGNSDRNFMNFTIVTILMIFIIILLPVGLIYIMRQPENVLEAEHFQSKWGEGYN